MYNVSATEDDSPLRKFIALHRDILLVLGLRRIPPVQSPSSNTFSAIPINTAFGFGMLETADYTHAIRRLRPDIVIAIGDVILGRKPSFKRVEKMADRTLSWLASLIEGLEDEASGTSNSAVFAPILPIEADLQSSYLDALRGHFMGKISGLVLYGLGSIEAIPDSLRSLPRFYAGTLKSPHQFLDAIEAGADILNASFINDASDAGIALYFAFPEPISTSVASKSEPQAAVPIGIDLWQAAHTVDVSPLVNSCSCYTCLQHHRAYLHHLLDAKEMLAWVLLQIHNYHVIDRFFEAVRQSLQNRTFDQQKKRFCQTYHPELPEATGKGPRWDSSSTVCS